MRLPKKPSALIRVALRDLEAVENNPTYQVDMYEWHSPDSIRGVCKVCLAGSVIANSLKGCAFESYVPSNFNESVALNALNDFRIGNIIGGLNRFKFRIPPNLHGFMNVPNYANDPKGFKSTLRKMATRLKRAGL